MILMGLLGRRLLKHTPLCKTQLRKPTCCISNAALFFCAGAFEESCAHLCWGNEGGGHSVANVKRMELKKPGSEPVPTPPEDVFARGRGTRQWWR
jgi:hypothetical protein